MDDSKNVGVRFLNLSGTGLSNPAAKVPTRKEIM